MEIQAKIPQIVFTIVHIVHINTNRLNGTRMRAAVNVLMKRKDATSVSKASWYTKSKKEVVGNFFASSCHGCQQQQLHIMNTPCSYTTDFSKPLYLHKYSATKQMLM